MKSNKKAMKKVKIYTTPTCPYCEMAKTFFRENNVEFEEIDVSSDREAAMEMIEKSGQMGVPVIEIDDKIIVGFDVNAIKKALEGK
ncbi:MAG: glutaredoxin family protein [Candidatus Aenigmatarchaeota archaeon]